MQCPFCMSEKVQYMGIDDGAGDYGEAIAENWLCNDCLSEWESYDAYYDLLEAKEVDEDNE